MAYEDLLKDSSKPDPDDKNYFIVTITDLLVNKTYPIQFRWKYKDGSFGTWSAVKKLNISNESVNAPSTPSLTVGAGVLFVNWNGNDSSGNPLVDIDRVNVLVGGVYYGSIIRRGSSGSLSLSLPKGTYSVTLVAVSKLGNESSPSTSASATITVDVGDAFTELENKLEAGAGVIANASSQIVSIDTGSGLVVYSASTGGSASSGNRVVLNSEGLAGFRSVIENSVTVDKASFAILTQTKYYDPVTEIMYTSPGTGRLTIDAGSGFFSGTLNAKAGIFSGAITVGDTQMQFGDDIPQSPKKVAGLLQNPPVNDGSSTGIYIDSTNYWYAVSTEFKVGGSTNYVSWNGSQLEIKGNVEFGASDYVRTSGAFSFGTGILYGTTSSIVINLGNGDNNFTLSNMLNQDGDQFAGDPTITIQPSGKIVKGRAIIHNATTTPTSADINWANKTFNQVNRGAVPIKAGDLILVGE